MSLAFLMVYPISDFFGNYLTVLCDSALRYTVIRLVSCC